MRIRALAAVSCSVLALSACGSLLGDDDPVVIGSPSDTVTTTAPGSTPDPSAATPAAPGASPGATAVPGPPGTEYADPAGTYSVTLGRKWTRTKSTIQGDLWVIGPASDGVKPLLSVVTEDLTAAPGITLTEYMRLSLVGLKKEGLVVLRSGQFTSPDGSRMGAIEYTGKKGTPKAAIRSLAVVDLSPANAAVATLIVAQRAYPKVRPAALPYLETLNALD